MLGVVAAAAAALSGARFTDGHPTVLVDVAPDVQSGLYRSRACEKMLAPHRPLPSYYPVVDAVRWAVGHEDVDVVRDLCVEL